MASLIDGKKISKEILLNLKKKIVQLDQPPGLAVVLIGDDPASKIYINTKKKACEKVGIEFHKYLCKGKFCPNATEEEILEMIDFLNKDPKVNGIIVQLPIPEKFDTQKIINKISPEKDVDGFHPENQKKLLKGEAKIVSPLIGAVNLALANTDENLVGKKAVIVGKNPIFYQALQNELERQKIKTEAVDPNDKNLEKKIKQADILTVIIGQKHFIKKTMVKKNAIVVDIGTNLIGEKKWAGDVDPEVAEVAGWLTPVPGGIGPLTVACLLKNTYQLSRK